MRLGHRVPNIKMVWLSPLYYILLLCFIGRFTIGLLQRGGTSVLNTTRLVIVRGITLLKLLWEKIKFLLPLPHLLHLWVLLLLLLHGLLKSPLYALATRQDSEASFDVVTSMLRLFYCDAYFLLDPRSTILI